MTDPRSWPQESQSPHSLPDFGPAYSESAAPVDPSAGVRDAVVKANIGISAAATAGSGAATSMLVSQGAATGAGAAAPGGAATVASLGGKAGGVAVAVKVTAGAVGAVVVGGAIVAGVTLTNGGGTGTQAPLSPPEPMNEAIMDFQFEGAMFDSGFQDPVALYDMDTMGMPDAGPDDPLPYYTVGEPKYVDIDGDRDLDAAILIGAYAGGGTPSLYVWLWEDGEAVQAKRAAAIGEDCGDNIVDFRTVDEGIEVDMMVGSHCDQNARQQEQTMTVTIQDGYPVQVEPERGAVDTCFPEVRQFIGEAPDSVEPLVAPFADAPEVAGPADIDHVDVLDWSQGGDQEDWRLAMITLTDETIVCGWVPPGTV